MEINASAASGFAGIGLLLASLRQKTRLRRIDQPPENMKTNKSFGNSNIYINSQREEGNRGVEPGLDQGYPFFNK